MESLFFDNTKPMDYRMFCSAAEKLKSRYDFLQCFSIGKSVLNRKLTALIIGKGSHPTLFVGTHHALEYMTAMMLTQFAAELCEHYESGEPLENFDVKKILCCHCVYIIPMLNPDGVELHLNGLKSAGRQKDFLLSLTGGDFSNWQANAHGVDLNHNYNAGFRTLRKLEEEMGISGAAPTRFGGKSPESEPETHALCNLCRRMSFSKVFAFHSQGEEIYWNYEKNTPIESEKIAQTLAKTCDYKVSKPEKIASYGGFKDWFIEIYGRPGFTVEIGKGKNPLPINDFESNYLKCRKLMLTALDI